MRGWDHVRRVLVCAYGCEIPHGAWAWFGKYPMVLCEAHAAQYGIQRPVPYSPAQARQHWEPSS